MKKPTLNSPKIETWEDFRQTVWAMHRDFCHFASQTQDMNSNSVSDFLGYLERVGEIDSKNNNNN